MAILRKLRDSVKKFEVPLFIIAVVLGTFLAIASALRGAKYPNEAIWLPWEPLFVAMLVAGVFVPVYAFYKALDAYLLSADEGQAKLQSDLELVCQRTVAAIADACAHVTVNDLSAQVWLCKEDDTFDRRACFMLPEARPRSGIKWRKGKGIAGTAWESETVVSADLQSLGGELKKLGDTKFDELPASKRYGMTAAEVRKTADYAGICAVPLFSQGEEPRILGVFVIDYIAENGFECVKAESEKRPVENFLAASEGILTDAEAILPL